MISARRTKQPRSWLREGRSIRLVQFWGNGFSARREGIRRNRFGRRSPRGLTPHPVILTEREERHKGRRLRAARAPQASASISLMVCRVQKALAHKVPGTSRIRFDMGLFWVRFSGPSDSFQQLIGFVRAFNIFYLLSVPDVPTALSAVVDLRDRAA